MATKQTQQPQNKPSLLDLLFLPVGAYHALQNYGIIGGSGSSAAASAKAATQGAAAGVIGQNKSPNVGKSISQFISGALAGGVMPPSGGTTPANASTTPYDYSKAKSVPAVQPGATTTPPGNKPPATGGGGGGGGLNSLISELAKPNISPYQTAIDVQKAQLPIIQQRYQALLDQLSASETQQEQLVGQATASNIGETRARSAAQGVLPSSTEVGTEGVIRDRAAQVIANLKQTGDVTRTKALLDEATAEGNVNMAIAKLGIDEATAEQSGLRDAIQLTIDMEKARTANLKTTVTTLNMPDTDANGQPTGTSSVHKVVIDTNSGNILSDYGAGSGTAPTKTATATKTGSLFENIFGLKEKTTTTTTEGLGTGQQDTSGQDIPSDVQ